MTSDNRWRAIFDEVEDMLGTRTSRLLLLAADRKIEELSQKLDRIIQKQEIIMATLVDIQAAVAAEKTVEDSVLALLAGLAQQLKDAIAANDPVAMQAVVDSLNSNAAAMASAVTANTPAPTPPTP